MDMGNENTHESPSMPGTAYVLSGRDNDWCSLTPNGLDYGRGNEVESVLLGETRPSGFSTTDRIRWTTRKCLFEIGAQHPLCLEVPRTTLATPGGTISSLPPGRSDSHGEARGRMQGQATLPTYTHTLTRARSPPHHTHTNTHTHTHTH
uniref:Uncharacterized protein n=1 Tax=Molossus molossus TaxID=27622 RepID=A0A7J8J0L5_MOLMO|nr:hypothetical protein HJG59_010394 [Molossus molossus]